MMRDVTCTYLKLEVMKGMGSGFISFSFSRCRSSLHHEALERNNTPPCLNRRLPFSGTDSGAPSGSSEKFDAPAGNTIRFKLSGIALAQKAHSIRLRGSNTSMSTATVKSTKNFATIKTEFTV